VMSVGRSDRWTGGRDGNRRLNPSDVNDDTTHRGYTVGRWLPSAYSSPRRTQVLSHLTAPSGHLSR